MCSVRLEEAFIIYTPEALHSYLPTRLPSGMRWTSETTTQALLSLHCVSSAVALGAAALALPPQPDSDVRGAVRNACTKLVDVMSHCNFWIWMHI